MVEINVEKEKLELYASNSSFDSIVNNHEAGKILFIDEDYVNFLYFSELLSGTHYEVLGASSLDQAFQTMVIEDNISMIVLSDWFLTNENNAFLRLLKNSFPGIPFVLMVYRENQFLDEINGINFDLYVNRETDGEHLIESIPGLNK